MGLQLKTDLSWVLVLCLLGFCLETFIINTCVHTGAVVTSDLEYSVEDSDVHHGQYSGNNDGRQRGLGDVVEELAEDSYGQ